MPWYLAGKAHEVITIRTHHSYVRLFLYYPFTPWLRTEFLIFWNSYLMIFHQSIELLECIWIQKLLYFLRINLLRAVNVRALHFVDLSRRIYHKIIIVWEARPAKEMTTDLQISDFFHFALHIADITVEGLFVSQFFLDFHQMIIFTMLYLIKGVQLWNLMRSYRVTSLDFTLLVHRYILRVSNSEVSMFEDN